MQNIIFLFKEKHFFLSKLCEGKVIYNYLFMIVMNLILTSKETIEKKVFSEILFVFVVFISPVYIYMHQ